MRKYIALCLLLLGHLFSHAQSERIIDYHTDISLNSNRSIIVAERIQIYAAGQNIKRGITRNLPAYRMLKENKMRMKYDILEVKKNGVEEPYFMEGNGDDEVLYIGSRDVFLKPDIYTYEIKYHLPNQIAFYDDFDEFYWNAIGTDVQFKIENASCSFRIPEGIELLQQSAYTGKFGSTDKAYQFSQSKNHLNYVLTKALAPREGFTVALGFEKGFFEPPSFFQKYGTLVLIIAGILFLIPYYIHTWWKYGQDPSKPAAVPRWDIPENLSPASLNYIHNGYYQSAAFTSSIIALAINGFLRIEEVMEKTFFGKSRNYELVKVADRSQDMAEEEDRLFDEIFEKSDRMLVDGEYDSQMKSTYDAHKTNLGIQHKEFIHEGDNVHLLWIPILATIVVAGLAILFLVNSPYAEWINTKALIIFVPLALIGFFLYVYLIKKPTVEKLKLRSEILGLKMYLEMAEKDRLNLLNPPEMTPEHFEAVLPYAFALGVEHKWTEKFEAILKQAAYEPQWHHGGNHIYFYNHFGQDFSKSVGTAATPPSSSGGSGGGGFSGGGGGGGGVGGW